MLKVSWRSQDPHLEARGTTLLYSSDGGTSWVVFAQAQPASGSYEWKIPQVVDGRQILLRARVRDRAGNTGQGQLGRELRIGIKTLQLVLVGPLVTSTRAVTLTYKALSLDPRAKLAWIQLYISADGVNWTKGPRQVDRLTGSLPYTLPANGRFGLILQAADTLGNIESAPGRGAQAEITIEVDSTPPIVRLKGFDQRDVYHGRTSYTIRWDKLIDNNLGDKPVSLAYQRAPSSKWVAIAENLPDSQSYLWTVPGSGSYRIKLMAKDRMGNQAEATSAHSLVVSTKPPVVTIVGPDRVLSGKRNVIVQFRVQSELKLAIDKIALYWSLNGGQGWNQLTTFRVSGENVTRFKDGSYGVRYEGQDGSNGVYLVAYDRPGNHNAKPVSGTRPMVTYDMDSQPPAVTISDTLGGKVFGAGEQVSISWRIEEGNLPDRPISIRLSSDGGYNWAIEIAKNIANSGSYSFRLPAKPPKSGRLYRLKIEVKDKVGHVGKGVTELFTIDLKPPTTRFPSMPKHIARSPFVLKVAVADQDGAGVALVEAFAVKLDAAGNPTGQWNRSLFSPWQGNTELKFDLTDGYWGLLLVATDKKGNRQAVRGQDGGGMPTASTPPQARIVVHVTGPKVDLLSLTGGQTIAGGTPQVIRWRTARHRLAVERVVLSISTNSGQTYAPIGGAQALQNSGRFDWRPPADMDYGNVRIRVEVFNAYGQRGVSSSAQDIYIDNGKPTVTDMEIEEADDDDPPKENDPEVKAWFSDDPKKQAVLKPDNNNMRAGTETEAFERLSANAAKHFINRAYRAAEKALRESLRIKRGWGQGHYLLALIHKKRGQPTAIILRELKAAIAFDSTLAEAYNDIGFIHFQQKRFRKAGLLFERALAASPAANYKRNRARFHYNLGLALHEQRKTAQALKAFEQAVEANRMLGEAWYYVAWLADLQGNQLLARRALSRIEALYPSSSKYNAWAKYKLSK